MDLPDVGPYGVLGVHKRLHPAEGSIRSGFDDLVFGKGLFLALALVLAI